MKQIVIRILGPQLRVFDFAYGEISEGSFVPLDVNDLPVDVSSLVHVDSILGTQAYVEDSNLADLFKVLLDFDPVISIYPNFIVFTFADFPVHEESQKTEKTA